MKFGVKARWKSCDVLIVDEISMIGGDFFEKLEEIARLVRRNTKPFGGIQLIASGDFLQLPPVDDPQFCFQSDAFKRCNLRVVMLKKIFRQADEEFIRILSDIRVGILTPEGKKRLDACKIDQSDGIEPTRLYPHRRSVEDENQKRLAQLPGNALKYTAHDSGEVHLLKGIIAPDVLILKVGAQVVYLKNDSGLVNGSRGVVTGFIKPEGKPWPIVNFGKRCIIVKSVDFTVEVNRVILANRRQLPLMLAWALTIHKCQGMTLTKAEIHLTKSWENGMVYVALSRVKSLEGAQVYGLEEPIVHAEPNALEWTKAHQ